MVAATKKQTLLHLRALETSSALADIYRHMYRPAATMVTPKKIIRLLNDANVRFVLMGTHGLGGWRSSARATEDVDVLVAKKDHSKAVRVLRLAFPKMIVEDGPVVTRFKDPVTREPRIDLMKPWQTVYQMVFRHTQMVGDSHRVPSLEMALVAKFAAMVSPYREHRKKIQDAADFADMVIHNKFGINMEKLVRLADQVYSGGRKEIYTLIQDILAGRPIQV